jgi:hypothetical protein
MGAGRQQQTGQQPGNTWTADSPGYPGLHELYLETQRADDAKVRIALHAIEVVDDRFTE